jgi:alanine racemase
MPPLVESIPKSQYATWLEIRLDRLLANLKTLKQHAFPSTNVMAVIKANAYGHGLLEIARTLSGEVTYLGISSIREALELKEHHIEVPVFIFGRLLGHEIPAALMEGVTLSVSSFEEAREISELSRTLGRKTLVHVKVDTGMGRLGIPFPQALPVIEKMTGLEGILLEGIYTHFPTAERDDGFTDRQLNDFSALIEALASKGIAFHFRHAANSAGILKKKSALLNLVRPGLMLYGIYPDISLTKLASVSPILSLKSRIISLKRLSTGESAGYGRDFTAARPTTIALLPIGYSHGYPFTASSRAQVLYRGKRFSVAGRVSMDYLTVDLGDEVSRVGEEVTILGEDNGDCIFAEDLASWAGTIPYEIVTRFLPSLPRLYR